MPIRKIKAALVNEPVDTYIGEETYLFYDTTTGSLRLWTGAPGGVLVAGPGSSGLSYTRSITTNDSLTGADDIVFVNGSVTISLPDATIFTSSKRFTIKNVGMGIVYVQPVAGQTIDGQTLLEITQQYTSRTLTSTSTGWYLI